jgi:hypothetical protein
VQAEHKNGSAEALAQAARINYLCPMSKVHQVGFAVLAIFSLAACVQVAPPPKTPLPATAIQPLPSSTPEPRPILGAGFRYSSYGPWYDPGPDYWVSVGEQMASRFPGAIPETVWIVGTFGGRGTTLNFPGSTDEPYIFFTSQDKNEELLKLFDEMGGRVWLQVEPGDASVEALIHILLDRYGEHPSLAGVGVDVEWYQSEGDPEGQPVSDKVAAAWVAAARQHGPQYRIFLKHWLPEYMPPTVRDGILFIDDSQGADSLEKLVGEFQAWAERFAPWPVGFQYGYTSDQPWWKELDDPPGDIGQAILAVAPNTAGLYWVDFTVLEIFPPER